MSGGPRSIVAAYNGTEACQVAVRRAAALSLRMGATLRIASVQAVTPVVGSTAWAVPYEPLGPTQDAVRKRAHEGAALVQEAVDAVPHALFGAPPVEIVRLAKEAGAVLIVLGSSPRSALERFLLGATADRILRLSPVPCLVAASPHVAQRLLVAVDDSLHGARALRVALRHAAATGAEVRCVHVVPAPPPGERGRRELEDSLPKVRQFLDTFVDSMRAEAAAEGPVPEVVAAVRAGAVGKEILLEAEACEADLIVAGTHGRGFLQRAILGSTSEHLLHNARTSLLIVPASEE